MKKIMILILMMVSNVFAESFEYQNTDFKSLYNNYQSGQPEILPWAGDFFSYAFNGTAVGLDHRGERCGDNCGRSPMQALGELTGNQKAYEWEKENHSCEKLSTEEEKESCAGWWGHCNGWSAAAIKEREPKTSMQIRGVTLTVGEQKGILSELWLSCNNLFTGNTNKSKKTDAWVKDINSNDGKSFWDVTPRTFFMLITNYIGVLKTGVVIDRFTGDQVWNQPVVGYKHSPIKKRDIWTEDGKYFLRLTTEIYWADDIGTSPGHISSRFDIHDANVLNHLDQDYNSRSLTYVLQFDSPVILNPNGQIESAGRLIGDGSWQHYLDFVEDGSSNASGLDQTHPDFIWLPTNPIIDQSGYGNPYLDLKTIQEISKNLNSGLVSVPTPVPTPAPVTPPDVSPTPVTPTPSPTNSVDYILRVKILNEKIKMPSNISDTDKKQFITKAVSKYLSQGNYNQITFAIEEISSQDFVIRTRTQDPKAQKEIKKIISKLDGEILAEQVPNS